MKSSTTRRRSSVPHSVRPEVRGVCHVVLRVQRGLPWLRTPRAYRVLERAFRRGKEFSSGRWYSGWYEGLANLCRPLRAPPVARSRDLYLTMPSFRCLSVAFIPERHAAESEPFDPRLAF